MEIAQTDEGKNGTLRNLAARGSLRTSIGKLSGSSRILPSQKDFHFYNNFPEFKNPAREFSEKSKNLLIKIGASEDLLGKAVMFPPDEKMELDDDVANDWLENVNDIIFEKFDVSLDEFKRLRKKEEESGVRKMRVNAIDDESESGFQMVYGKKNKKKFSSLDANVEEFRVKSQEVRIAEKVKPKVPFHIPTIPRPQEEYKIIVNNLNQPFEHVWLDRSEDGSTFVHYLVRYWFSFVSLSSVRIYLWFVCFLHCSYLSGLCLCSCIALEFGVLVMIVVFTCLQENRIGLLRLFIYWLL